MLEFFDWIVINRQSHEWLRRNSSELLFEGPYSGANKNRLSELETEVDCKQ